jgi:sigma-E factor negative regulatory protein RseB
MGSMIGIRTIARPTRTAGLLGLALVASSVTFFAPAGSAAMGSESGGPGVGPDPAPQSNSRARALLHRVTAAEARVRYRGTQFVTAWDESGTSTSVVEVANVPGYGTSIRTRGGADGAPFSVFTSSGAASAKLGGGPVELIASNYSIRRAGTATVAGRTVRVLDMLGEGEALAARFWIDSRTGVLLRREVYDGAGRTVRASAFFDIRISDRARPGHLPPMLPVAQAEYLGSSGFADLRQSGCTCPTQLADHLDLYQVQVIDDADGAVLHLSYSDGLSTVSVFQQPGQVDDSGLADYTEVTDENGTRYVREGLPQRIVWSAGGVTFAVVADAPADTVAEVLATLPTDQPAADGVVDRVGRGLVRVASWINPFA